MKIHTKLLIMLILVAGIGLATPLIHEIHEKDEAKILLANERTEKSEYFEKLLALQSSKLKTVVDSFTYSNDLVDLIGGTQDGVWAEQNMTAAVSVYDLSGLWVYKSDFSAAYSTAHFPNGTLKTLPFSKAQLSAMFSKTRFVHSFVQTAQGLLELCGAPVFSVHGGEKEIAPKGYFFSGRIWDQEYLQELSRSMGGKVQFVGRSNAGLSIAQPGVSKPIVIVLSKTLTDWNHSPVTDVQVRIESQWVEALERSAKQGFIFDVSLSFGLVVVFVGFFIFWVSRPLKSISNALEREDDKSLKHLQKDPGELGRLARLIISFFEQRNHLVKEIYERKQMEMLLRATNRFNEEIISSAAEGIVVYDRRICYVVWNHAMERMTGLAAQDVVGQSAMKLFPEFYENGIHSLLERAFAGEILTSADTPFHISQTGKSCWVCATYGPHRDAGGEIIGVIGLVRDITERKRTEEKLRLSEVNYRSVYNAANDAIFIHDAETGAILDLNKKGCEMFGYTADQIRTMSVEDISSGASIFTQKEALDYLHKAAEGKPQLFEWMSKRQSGEHFWVEVNIKCVVLGGKKRLLAIVRDISERKRILKELEEYQNRLEGLVKERTQQLEQEIAGHKRTEEALRESEQKYRNVVDNIGIGVSLIDRDMRILTLNKQMRTWFPEADVSKSPLCYRVFNDPPREGVCSYCPTRKSFEDGLGHEAVTETPAGDRIINYRVISSPIKDQNGNVIAVVEMVEDITDRKRSEEEIKKLNEELQRHVAQLEIINKEMETFSYSVSHDLRAPLRVIAGFSRVLFEDYYEKLDQEGRRLLGIVEENVRQMAKLIEDLLALSYLGYQDMNIVQVDMAQLVKAVVDELKSVIGNRNVRFELKDLPAVLVDLGMIRQVIFNLVSNAVKFTRPKETATIEIGGWSEERQNVYYVKDNGVGFDMEYSAKLFGAFQRLHHRDEFEGTGIGLALTQRVVRRHGGRVWAEGRVGEGATFYFSLPKRGSD